MKTNKKAQFKFEAPLVARDSGHAGDYGDWGDDFGFGEPGDRDHIAGPLIGGGGAQAATLAAKMLFKSSPTVQKWAPAIGALVGAGISAGLMMSPRFKRTGMSGLVTALVVGVPRQIEDLLMGGSTAGYLGVITPEMEMQGAYDQYAGYLGEQPQDNIQLLDAGAGSTGMLGVITAENEMNGAPDVEMLGGGSGFGANFLQ